MRRLYKDKDALWKEDANKVHNDVHYALKPIMEEWVRKGYSPREIAHIMVGCAMDIEAHTVLATKLPSLRNKKSQIPTMQKKDKR